MKLNEHNLLEHLKKNGFEGKVQEETNQIYVVIEQEKKQYPLFIRRLHDDELVQILTFIPCGVKPEAVADVARFLHMLNKELDVPGFCLDEASMTIFYRLLMPTVKKEFDPAILDAYLNTTQVVCKSFSNAIIALAQGAMSLDEILKKAESHKAPAKKS